MAKKSVSSRLRTPLPPDRTSRCVGARTSLISNHPTLIKQSATSEILEVVVIIKVLTTPTLAPRGRAWVRARSSRSMGPFAVAQPAAHGWGVVRVIPAMPAPHARPMASWILPGSRLTLTCSALNSSSSSPPPPPTLRPGHRSVIRASRSFVIRSCLACPHNQSKVSRKEETIPPEQMPTS